jgi:hypothetical protein
LTDNKDNWLQLASLCSNAYERDQSTFLNVSGMWSMSLWDGGPPGSEDMYSTLSQIIVAIKGTSFTLPVTTPSDMIPTDDVDKCMVSSFETFYINFRIISTSLVALVLSRSLASTMRLPKTLIA